MKTTKRNVALALIALFSGQLLVSCSGTKMQWSKNEVQDQTFASSQYNNKPVADKAPVLKAKEFTFNAQAEVEAPVLASISNEIPVAKKQTATNLTVADVNKFAAKNESKIVKVKEQLKQMASPEGTKAKGKNQWLAFILAGLVGFLGVHRFYLGYTWQGIVQLLTFGGCGIWYIVDWVRILLGKLQPKDGSYTEGKINIFN